MFKQNRKNKRSQAILDFVLIFGILVALLAGMIRIWVWFDTSFAKRNVDYQNERLSTAGHYEYGRDYIYSSKPLAIDENWVFKGQASGSVGSAPAIPFTVITALSGDGNDGTALVCESAKTAATALRTQADNMDGQADQIDDFVWWGEEWYRLKALFLAMNIDVDGMCEARDALYENAVLVRNKAIEIECAGCKSSAYGACT